MRGTSVGDARFTVARTLSSCSSRESSVGDYSHFTMGRTLGTSSTQEAVVGDRSYTLGRSRRSTQETLVGDRS